MSNWIEYHTDAGHGWLAVSLIDYPDAVKYGTGYGYFDGEYIYLEEDCEATAFLKDHEQVAVRHVQHDGDAWIRRLPHNDDMTGVQA